MAGRSNGRYSPEYKARIVELARAGRSAASLAAEFGPSDQTIRNWVRRADLDEGRRSDGLTTEARKGMTCLKRENKRLQRGALPQAGIARSMGAVGHAYDNGMCESFFAMLECERARTPSAALCSWPKSATASTSTPASPSSASSPPACRAPTAYSRTWCRCGPRTGGGRGRLADGAPARRVL